MKIGRLLSSFSAFSEVEAHLAQKTVHGAIVTILGACLALFLLFHETAHFWRLHATTKMDVDVARRTDMAINIDISFPAVPCAGRHVWSPSCR